MLLESKGGLKVKLPETTSPPQVRKSINWEVRNEEGSTDYVQEYKGYSLAHITLYWELSKDEGDVYEVMRKIERVYSHVEKGKPAIWKVVDKFLNAQGIRYVVARDWEATEETEGEAVKITLVLVEYKPKEIEKEKKSGKGKEGKGIKVHPCEKDGALAKSECRRLYIKWRKEKEEALRQGKKTFPDFKTWMRSQPVSPASDDEG